MSASTPSRPLAVVTGPTAGIGRAFADRLAARGHDLLLVSRDATRLRQVADELAARHGIAAEIAAHDLTDPAQVEALATALAARPHVDVLINNAGFGTLGTLLRTDPAAQAAMIQLHCATPLRLVQAALPGMVARRAGLIVNVCSVAAFVTGPGNATYSGTKAFLRVATDGLSAELTGTGVQVQALCPGFTRTEFHDRMGFAPSNIPRALWMTPDAVVDASLRAADRGGPVTVIPGPIYRVAVAVLRHLPLRVLSLVIRRAPRNRT
ncbi:MAG: SDR family NAD(P)-dependent oxidoreductase [Gemmatirosa sp.]